MMLIGKSHLLSLAAAVPLICCSLSASANFYVDYQGLDLNNMSVQDLRAIRGKPEGYRVLADKTYGVVHQIGKGEVVMTDSFGTDMPLKDAISMLMPSKWIAYIDEGVKTPSNVDWYAKNEPWVDVMAQVGINYGYRFIVDWDQKLLQITPDENFTAPNYDDPITLKDPESGRLIFVYSAKPVNNGDGVLIVEGESIPVKINDK